MTQVPILPNIPATADDALAEIAKKLDEAVAVLRILPPGTTLPESTYPALAALHDANGKFQRFKR